MMENTQAIAETAAPAQNHAESDNGIVESNDFEILARDWFEWRFEPDEDARDGVKERSRQDALKALSMEFWMSRPDRHPDDVLDNHDVLDVNDGHPRYDLYKQIQTLIHAHYDEIYDKIEAGILDDASTEGSHDVERDWAGTETSLIRKTESQLRDAIAARRCAGGYKNFDGRDMHWKECLPSQVEIMLSRFVDPYGAMHDMIAGMVSYLEVGWMGCIN